MASAEGGFLTLSAPAAALAAQKLSATDASPLKARAEKARAGASNGAAIPESGAYHDALGVLARPESLIRVRIAEPGEEPSDVALLVRDGKAAPFLFKGEGVMVGPARDLASVADSLAAEARHEGPLLGQQILLWPSSLKLLSLVWGRDQDASATIPRAEAERRLAGEGRPPEKVKAALDEMVEGGILVATGDALQIVPTYRPFLDRVWSGRALQIEHLPLVGAPSFEAALAQNGPHLLFVGPPGDRILSEPITGEALQKWLKGSRPTEETAIRLAAPPPDVLKRVVRLLIGLEKA